MKSHFSSPLRTLYPRPPAATEPPKAPAAGEEDSRGLYLLANLSRKCTPFRYDASGKFQTRPTESGTHLTREA